jgi:hypothetical protein
LIIKDIEDSLPDLCIARGELSASRAETPTVIIRPKDLYLLLNLLRWWHGNSFNAENIVAKPNYHQARKQRELARKARQLEKQQRRSARASVVDASSQVAPLEDAANTPRTPVPGGG